jgi:hypothetical protein
MVLMTTVRGLAAMSILHAEMLRIWTGDPRDTRPKANIGWVGKVSQFEVLAPARPISYLAKVASASGFVDTERD